MALPVYLSIAILLIHLSLYIWKPLSFLQNSLIYMTAVFIHTQFLTLIRMEFHLIEKSNGNLDYVAFLLYRNILIPSIVMIFCNFFLRHASWKNKILLFIGSVIAMVVFDWLSTKLGIISFIHWNLWFSGMIYALLLLIALGAVKIILYINDRESSKDESI
jgi:hypothetical protein